MFEKKRGKRFLASVMALVMLLSLAPVGALAAGNEDPQENTAVTLPANETDPKPVVTDEGNTANTNEEPTPPPRNEDYAETPADNNDASTAISEMSTDTSTKSNAAAGQTAYFYALLPGVGVPTGEYNPDEWWYGMGIGSITNVMSAYHYSKGQQLNYLLETNDINYPSHPNLTINGTTYTYDGTGQKENSYSIVWKAVVVENGANVGKNEYNRPGIAAGTKTYHVDGTIVLNETEYCTVMFKCKYPDSNTFEEVKDSQYSTYRMRKDSPESTLTQPNMKPISGYRFDGWYRDEECTQKAEFDGTITENVTYYGKYVEQTYSIRYELNGGSNSNMNPATYTYGVGVPSFANATKPGYTFGGWYSDAAFEKKVEKIDTTESGNKTLYAQWKANTYTVTFKTENGGKINGNTSDVTHSVAYDSDFPRTPEVTADTHYEFDKWVDENGNKVTTFPEKVTGNATYIAKWKQVSTDPTPVTPVAARYIVEHYKWNAVTKTYNLEETEYGSATAFGTEVTARPKQYDDYTLNLAAEGTVQKGTIPTFTKDDPQILTLKLYYDIDKIGSGENKDQPDGIPDRYQVTINYVSSNTNWGSVSPLSKEVITLKNGENLVEEATITTTASTATSAGGRCYFVNWTKKQEGTTDVSTVTPSANLTAQTFNAKGGDVYTFTANFDRSSGGGSGGSNRPKPPVVEIPDDVPTGLNGKDHYAYIIGYGNNDVRPQNNITRAEVATIFFRLLTDETREANMTKSNSYNDVKDGDWFCCAVSTLSKMGIIKGYEDGSFKPNDPISRAEFAAIAARFDPDGDKTPASFADVTSHWAKDEISIAANHGWIKGYEDGSFKPDQKITRAETMTLVNRVLNRLPETKDDLHKDMKTWVDNMDETAWYYLAVQEATNSHYFKNKTSTKFEQWTDLRDTRDWSELEK